MDFSITTQKDDCNKTITYEMKSQDEQSVKSQSCVA